MWQADNNEVRLITSKVQFSPFNMRVSFALLAQVAVSLPLIASCINTGHVRNQSYITKSLALPDGQTYVYDFASARNSSKPTILLLHGYPTSRHDWEHQITALTAEGFGVIAPDLLGFGDSSKPTAIEAYNTKVISGHLMQILDSEGLQDVVGVGHDIGAVVLSKAVTWYPERFSKLVFVTVSYLPAVKLFDLDAANKLSLKTFGYQQFGFWYFFNSWDAADLMRRNVSTTHTYLIQSDERTNALTI